MGRTISLYAVRGASIVCAALLLFAVFGHAHAQSAGQDADNYGLKPLPPGDSSANFAPAPQPGPPPGFAPAPAGPAAPPAMAQASPQPLPGPPPQLAPSLAEAPYGYNNGDGGVPIQPPATAMPTRLAAAAPYAGYQPVNNGMRADSSYVLGSGDKIHLNVFDEPDLTGDFSVDGTGLVRLPLIGQVRAAGLTSSQLEGAIGGALSRGYLKSPRVSVEVSTYRPFYIIGAVNRPGEYPYVNHMTALNAVALAGGYLPSAVESALYIRPEGSAREYKMPADAGTLVHPGDVVRVDTTFFWDTMSLFSPLTGVATVAAAGVR